MKKKTLSNILVIGLICSTLTGCASFSYGSPVEGDSYVAELPNGETVILDKEEAEKLAEFQENLQEELGISDEELAELREDFADYEDNDYEEETETESKPVKNPYDFNTVFGRQVRGGQTYLGVQYDIYENGAVLRKFVDEFGTLPKTIEHEGIEYPVIGIQGIEREEFDIPDFIQYIYLDDQGYIIKNLTIPDTVKYYEITFMGYDVESITFPENVPTKKFWDDIFHDNDKLQTISIPNGVETTKGTFENCSALTQVHLPDSLTTIGSWTFKNCSSLSEIVIPDSVTTIDNFAFENTKISSLTLPSNLQSFALSSIEGCPLEELILPNSVTTIGEYNFGKGDISNLPNIKKIVLPDSLEIDSLGIWCCPNLELVVFPDSIQEISFDPSTLNNPSNCTFKVPAKIAEYYQNKFPEINVVAKE